MTTIHEFTKLPTNVIMALSKNTIGFDNLSNVGHIHKKSARASTQITPIHNKPHRTYPLSTRTGIKDTMPAATSTLAYKQQKNS